MNNEFINQFNDSSKVPFEMFQQLNVINVEAMQKLAALQLNLTNLNIESTVEQAKLLGGTKDPQALFAAESAFAKNYGEKFMQLTSETTSVLTQSREYLMDFANKSLQATSPVKNAPAKPAKTTAVKKAAKKAA